MHVDLFAVEWIEGEVIVGQMALCKRVVNERVVAVFKDWVYGRASVCSWGVKERIHKAVG